MFVNDVNNDDERDTSWYRDGPKRLREIQAQNYSSDSVA
jgi:hypothetical protein